MRQALHQGGVVDGLNAMVDALHLQHIQRAPDIGRRAFLTRMGHQVQTQLLAAGEHPGKLLWRVAEFTAVQPHADELVAKWQGLLQRFKGRLFAQVAQEAQDQRGVHPQFLPRIHAGAVQAMHHRGHGHAALGVCLRVKEQLSVHHVVGRGTLEVGPGHVVEVLLVQQHAGACVVDIQEALQVRERVGAAQAFHIGIGQRHTIALGQRKNQFRLQRALDVDVQLGLGHLAQQFGQALGRNRGDFEHGQTPWVSLKTSCPFAI